MRTVELKIVAGRMDAKWVLSPGCAKAFARKDVLVVTDVPAEVTDAEVVKIANSTILNTPARPKEPPTVAFSRLGAGKLVNLVIGRPEGTTKPEEERKRPRSVSLNDEQAAKFGRLGGSAWLQAQIDAAPEPLH